jgi:hypothetical protein
MHQPQLSFAKITLLNPAIQHVMTPRTTIRAVQIMRLHADTGIFTANMSQYRRAFIKTTHTRDSYQTRHTLSRLP